MARPRAAASLEWGMLVEPFIGSVDGERLAVSRGVIDCVPVIDQGAIGNLKTEEKVLTLKISKKLKQLIISRLGLEVIMTREEDSEVSLNSRVSKANNQKAQMFVSVHVNSSYRRSAWGSETYYVSLKATDQEALLLSQRENESFEELEKIANKTGD